MHCIFTQDESYELKSSTKGECKIDIHDESQSQVTEMAKTTSMGSLSECDEPVQNSSMSLEHSFTLEVQVQSIHVGCYQQVFRAHQLS